MQSEYTRVKVNNEIELCETSDMDIKQQIERILLRNRISYYIKWYKQGFFWKTRNVCIFCVNESVKDEAEQLVRSLGKSVESKTKFLMHKTGGENFLE